MKKYQLPEQDGHIVSYSVYGNDAGPAIISFHGGPGSKSKPYHAKRYDLSKYRVVLFDQRGCGESTPLGKIENNCTEDLLNDAERIREALGIQSWFVSGGSWGSTLSLLYALKHPQRVKGLLLSAIFLGDRDSVNWAFGQGGASTIMPDVWERRMNFFKKFGINLESQNDDLFKLLEGADAEVQKEITAGVFDWEGNLFTSQSSIAYNDPADIDEKSIASAKVFLHYEKNKEFITDNYILNNIDSIAHIPTVIVHGRYDILCPMNKAKALADSMSVCTFAVATSSGHKLTPEGETILFMAYDRFLAENNK